MITLVVKLPCDHCVNMCRVCARLIKEVNLGTTKENTGVGYSYSIVVSSYKKPVCLPFDCHSSLSSAIPQSVAK